MNAKLQLRLFVVLNILLVVLSSQAAPTSANFTQNPLATPITTITRVSVDSSGTQAEGWSGRSSISADGRYVAFASEASNLVSDDSNGVEDIFLYDTQTSITTRISVNSFGMQGNDSSNSPSISADGRYVAFVSKASNLVGGGDTNGYYDVFIRDTQAGTTTLISVNSSGVQGNGDSSPTTYPSISANGRYVAFVSSATNLVSGDTNGLSDIFLRDTQEGTTTRISIDSSGVQSNDFSGFPSISANGRFVVFWSYASNLVSEDTNDVSDVFLHDTQTNTTSRISMDSSGIQGNGESHSTSISADGRYVAFDSIASNLIIGDTNNTRDIFLHDTQTGTTTRLSLDSSGIQGNGSSTGPSISADGRYVMFWSHASNLVNGDTNGVQDVFVHDTRTSTTARLSLNSSRIQGNDQSDCLPFSLSADGHYVAFTSEASNLVSGDTNGVQDVFVALNTLFAYQIYLPLVLRH